MGESYYFGHDYNARNDEKILKLRRDMGWEGFGIYWALVEKMYEAGGSLTYDCDVLAFGLSTEPAKVERVVKEYKLFRVFKGRFISTRVRKNLSEREHKIETAKRAAKMRWSSEKEDMQQQMRPHSDSSADPMPNKGKERKGNKKKILEQVVLPEWLDQKAWAQWVTHRQEIKHALTPSTIKLQLRFLERHKDKHIAIIEASITNGWQGLFELAEKKKSPTQRTWICPAKHEHPMGEQCGHTNMPRKSEPSGISSLLAKKYEPSK